MKNQMILVMILILLHIVVCIVVTFHRKHVASVRRENVMPLVYAVPFFGAVCYGVRLYEDRRHRLGGRDTDMKPKDIMKGRYQRIQVEENEQEQVVPLEEALLVNDAKVRHSLMLDILHKNPNEYIAILQKARNSDDTEVTHYATTMMMEIQTEYEKKLQQYEKTYKEHKDEAFLREFILFLQEFIDSGLLSGNIVTVYRKRLGSLLTDYFALRGSNKKGRLIFTAIENDLILENNEEAGELLQQAALEYPVDERLYMLYGHYYDNIRDYASFQNMLDTIRKNGIYLSHEGKEWLSFWN